MRIAILTNEYPPHIYGGAGVHVEYLTRELARVEDGNHSIEILCFGDQQIREGNLTVRGVMPIGTLPFAGPQARQVPGHDAPQPGDGRACSRTSTSSTATPGTPTWPAAWSSSSPGRGWS